MKPATIRVNLYVSTRADSMLHARLHGLPTDERADRVKQWALLGAMLDASHARLLLACDDGDGPLPTPTTPKHTGRKTKVHAGTQTVWPGVAQSVAASLPAIPDESIENAIDELHELGD